jgi:hypothetical protein
MPDVPVSRTAFPLSTRILPRHPLLKQLFRRQDLFFERAQEFPWYDVKQLTLRYLTKKRFPS